MVKRLYRGSRGFGGLGLRTAAFLDYSSSDGVRESKEAVSVPPAGLNLLGVPSTPPRLLMVAQAIDEIGPERSAP